VAADERAMRFGYLLSEIEIAARKIRNGQVDDIPAAMVLMFKHVTEANFLVREVSREALDGVKPK